MINWAIMSVVLVYLQSIIVELSVLAGKTIVTTNKGKGIETPFAPRPIALIKSLLTCKIKLLSMHGL